MNERIEMTQTSEFTMSTTVAAPYDETLARVRDLLTQAGFGVLTEIDLRETLRAKLGVEVAPQVILGACRPALAHRALEADARTATMLPCNVVVAAAGEGTRVEVFDPAVMSQLSDAPGLAEVAADARQRLDGMIRTLTTGTEGSDGTRS